MAYGLKYISTAYGLSSSEWKVEIYEKDFTPIEGALPISLSLVGDGIKIGYDREEDRFNTVYSRYAIIDLKVTDTFSLDTLQFDDERKFLIKIYRGNNVEFVGWQIPFFSSQAYEDVSISTISIQAKDGINQLKSIDFVDEYPLEFSHKQTVLSVISQCLRKLDYSIDLEVYYNKYEDGMQKTALDCPLSQLFINIKSLKDSDKWKDNFEVIKALLSDHDLRIFQANGKWVVISAIEIIDGSVTGRRYNYLGEKQVPSVTLSSDLVIGTGGLKIKSNSIVRKGIPIQSFVANFEFGQSRNLVVNGEFQNIVDYEPEAWTLSNNWENDEVTENVGGGIIFQNTYATRSIGINPDVPINDASLTQNKYLESSQINIETLGTFSLSSEIFTNAEIDAVRVRVQFYNEGNTNEMYVTNDGKLTFVPTSIYMYNSQVDSFKMLTLTWNNLNEYGTPIAFKYMRVRVYEGIRLRAGIPSSSEIKYKSIKVAGRPLNVVGEFIGKRIEVKNTTLPTSKKYDDVLFTYKDVESFAKDPEHVHKMYLSDAVGETNATSGKWKRTSETNEYSLIESRLIDRLSQTTRFGDIFEGSIFGYVSLEKTPYINTSEKRFLLLYCEYNVQGNSTEIVAVELYVNDFSISTKVSNVFSDGTVIDVENNEFTTKIDVGEKFDEITSAGGTTYGGLYTDRGIDSLPANSTDPRATNKGTLLLGPVNAQNIELGNFANNTLVEILGRFGIRNTNNFLGEFSVAGLTANRVATLPDRNIEINKWADLSGVPTSFTPTTHFHEIGEVNGLSVALAGKQLLNANLTSLGQINSNGIVRRTGANTFGIGTNDQITLSGDVTGTGTTSIATTLSETGVVAGTYRSVTVGIDGRVTDATTPTTIAGYGITDFWEQTLGGVFTPLNETIDSFDTLREVAEKVQGQLNTKQSKIDLYSGYDEALYNGVLVTDGGFLNWKVLDSDAISNFSTSVLGQVLTGFTAGSNTPITSSNTILSAFQDLQAQATANKNSLSGTLNYIPKFNSTSSIGNSTISDDGSVINIGDVAFLQDIVEGRKINLNYPVHFGNSRMYDNTGDDGVNVLVVDTTTLQLDVENVNVIGRLDISENLLSLAKKKYTTSDTWYASIDALYSELLITSSKTSFIGPVGVSVIGGIDGANVTTNNLWNFSVIPQVTYDATLSNQLVRLSQVQSLLSGGFSVSTTCVLAFDTDQSFTGAKTQGSYTTQTGDSILLTKQNAAHQNGVYVFDGTNWARNTANDTDPEIRGKGHLITNGTFANAQFVNNNSSFISMGSTAITYAQWSGSELDPIFTAHAAFNVTNTKISNWDAAFGWGNHNIQGYVKNTGDESIGGIKTFTAEFRGTDLRYSGTLKPSGYSPTGGGMVLMSASTTTNYWKTLAISDITGLQTEIDSKATTDANLVAISALNTNGFIKRTGVGTYAIDTTAYVNKAGDTMTGALNLANSVRVGGTGSSDDNTYLGKNALISRTTSGVGNTAIGASALGSDTSGANNTSLGRNSGASVTTGSYNLFLGSNVGSGITTGSNNVVIGGQVTGLSATLANNIIIADGAGNRRINVGSTGLVGFGLTSPAYRVDVSGDVNVTGMYRLNGSIGLDHQFLKSNGTTQEWATLNCGEISDIDTLYASKTFVDANYVKRITDEGERGFYLYADTENTVKEGFLFTNPDTGILGLHAYRLNGSIIEQYGFQLDKDGLPYWQYANGTRKRILTELDAVGGGSWNGGSVSNAVRFGNNTPILWMNPSETNLANHLGKIEYGLSSSSKVFTDGGGQPFTGGVGLLVESLTNVFLGAVNSIYIKGNKVYINNIELDMAKVAALIGK